MLDAAHEGYEYQDYLTVMFALQEILLKRQTEMLIDRKVVTNDKFDDLKLINGEMADCYQIKYSDTTHNHKLTLYDLSNGNGHNTSLSELFKSWKDLKTKYSEVRLTLCAAWNIPAMDDGVWSIIKECADSNFAVPSRSFIVDVEKLWPTNGEPLKSWRKFRTEMSGVERKEFVDFCEKFSIEIDLPKASLDLKNPGMLEDILFNLTKRLGIGVYPNQSLDSQDVIYRLASIVKNSRAIGKKIAVANLLQRLGVITDYGMLNQEFHVDESIYINDLEQFTRVRDELNKSKRLVFLGNPGSGKSWFVEKFVDFLKEKGGHVIRFNCYVALNDALAEERIKAKVLYGNFVGQLLEEYPELSEKKKSLYGADKEEVETLLQFVEDDCYIIIDGLDHIQRQYDRYKSNLAMDETEILRELSSVAFPDEVHIMLSSQPLDEFEKFFDNGYVRMDIDNWNEDRTKQLMKKYGIEDKKLEGGYLLSLFLQNKSQGNVLYLSYLLRQLQGEDISTGFLDSIPNYDPTLREYYDYLYSQIANKRIVFALCGVDFYLSSNEIKEITGFGNIIDDELKILYPILSENVVSGGVLIYHESFRRYIIETLKLQNVNINKTIYSDVIEWLQTKNFYAFKKAYCHLLKLMSQTEQYEEIIKLLKTDFVIMSIKYGYSYDLIKKNIALFLHSGCCLKNLTLIATANELNNVLEMTRDEVSDNKDYFRALCDLIGPKRLNAMLEYDGKSTFSKENGLNICYICSKAGIMPWWKLYIDDEKTELIAAEYPHYFRALIDIKGLSQIPKVLIDIEELENNSRTEFAEAIYDDVKEYLGIDVFRNIVEENELKHWEEMINEHELIFYTSKMFDDSKILTQMDNILKFRYIFENEAAMVSKFYSQIKIRLENGDDTIYRQAIMKYADINWFYNWIIFTLRIIRIYVSQQNRKKEAVDCIEDSQNLKQENETLSAMEILLKDTEVFKGQPRTCDLYGARFLILKTFNLALSLINTNESLQKALMILEKVSQNTTTSMDNTNGGPLPDYSFVELLASIINVSNKEIVLPFIINAKKAAEDTEVYGTTASIDFQLASLVSKFDMIEAEKYYDEGIRYLVAYGYHKEVSIEQILDSYSIYEKADMENAKKLRSEITAMTRALIAHTDRRITKHYLNRWFRILLETDISYALSFLNQYQLNAKGGWILEKMILDTADRLSYEDRYDEITVKLLESLPNNVTEELLDIAIKLLDRLLEYKSNSLAKSLYVNILSRFNIENDSHFQYVRYASKENLNHLLNIGKKLGISIMQYETYFQNISDKTESISSEDEKTVVFQCVSSSDAYKWFENNYISSEAYEDILNFINERVEDTEEILALFRTMIDKDTFGENIYGQLDSVKYLLENAKIGSREKSIIYCLIFCKSRSWGVRFTDTDDFVKAYSLEKDTAMDTLYEELYRMERNGCTMITQGIIKALDAIGADKEGIIDIWNRSYLIMKLRFPNLDKYIDIDNGITDITESLIGIVIGRMLDGEKEKMQVGYSLLEDYWMEKKEYELNIALKMFLEKFNEYNYLAQYAVLSFIQRTSFDFSEEYFKIVMGAVAKIYHTNDYLLDDTILQSGFQIYLVEKEESLPIIELDMDKYLRIKGLQELGDNSKTMQVSESSYNADKQLRFLSGYNIDVQEIYVKIRSSKYVQRMMKEFVSPMHRLTVDNTVFKSYIMQYAVLAIVKYGIKINNPLITDYLLSRITIDFGELDLYRKTRYIPPEEHLYEHLNEDSSVLFICSKDDSEYQRIACFEISIKSERHNSVSVIEAHQGIGFIKNNKPLKKEVIKRFEGMEGEIIEEAEGALCFNGNKYDSYFESEEYLWVINDIVREFNLILAYDKERQEYVGIDMMSDKTVLRLRNWRCNYIGDSEYSGYEIPLYNGAELLMKSSYIRKLEEKYGNLYISTKVKKIVDIENGIDKIDDDMAQN